MKRLLLITAFVLLVFSAWRVHAQFSQPATPVQQSTSMANAATKVSNFNTTVAQQLSVSATPSGSNYVYITGIDLASCQDATGIAASNVNFQFTAGITPSGNIPVWSISQVLAVDLCVFKSISFPVPLKSISPGTAVTLQSPASSTHTAYQANIYWYEAQ